MGKIASAIVVVTLVAGSFLSPPSARAENGPGFAERGKHLFVPPACMSEFHDVAPGSIQLAEDSLQPCLSEMNTGRQLKQETTHALAEQVGDETEVADEPLGARS